MKVLAGLFLLIFQFTSAQISFSELTMNTGDFTKVKVFDRINVELIKSDKPRLEVKGNRSKDLEFVNKNGELKIRMKFDKLLKGDDLTVKLYFTELTELEANEGSFVTSEHVFRQPDINITGREGSELNLKLQVEELEIKSVTGARVRLSGTSDKQDASLNTGGILDAQYLLTLKTKVRITTGGRADVHGTEVVDAKIRAGGDITIYGSPKKIHQDIKLGGSITESSR